MGLVSTRTNFNLRLIYLYSETFILKSLLFKMRNKSYKLKVKVKIDGKSGGVSIKHWKEAFKLKTL